MKQKTKKLAQWISSTIVWRLFIGIILFIVAINLGSLIGTGFYLFIVWVDVLDILEKIFSWIIWI